MDARARWIGALGVPVPERISIRMVEALFAAIEIWNLVVVAGLGPAVLVKVRKSDVGALRVYVESVAARVRVKKEGGSRQRIGREKER